MGFFLKIKVWLMLCDPPVENHCTRGNVVCSKGVLR